MPGARACQMAELRFFGGRSVEETAEVLKVSLDTIHRDFRDSRKPWLRRELTRGRVRRAVRLAGRNLRVHHAALEMPPGGACVLDGGVRP